MCGLRIMRVKRFPYTLAQIDAIIIVGFLSCTLVLVLLCLLCLLLLVLVVLVRVGQWCVLYQRFGRCDCIWGG